MEAEEEGWEIYTAGDRVEVYDEEKRKWSRGTVETFGRTPMGHMYAVRADDEFENDLPVVWGILASAEPQLMRPLVKGSEARGDDDA